MTYASRLRYADLHTHTYHSDGTRSPAEVIDVALAHGIEIVAISDHDNLAAYFEIKTYADSKGVTLIPATELSCAYEGVDIHILAYAFDAHDERVEANLRKFRDARQTPRTKRSRNWTSCSPRSLENWRACLDFEPGSKPGRTISSPR